LLYPILFDYIRVLTRNIQIGVLLPPHEAGAGELIRGAPK